MSKNSVKDVEDLNLMPDMEKKDGKAGANNNQKNHPQQSSGKDQRNKQGEHGNKPHSGNITPMPVNNNAPGRSKDNNGIKDDNNKPAAEAPAKPMDVAAVPEKPSASAPSDEKVLKSNSDTIRVVDSLLLEMRTGWTDESSDYMKAIDLKISALEEEIEELKVEKKRIEELISTQKLLKGAKNG